MSDLLTMYGIEASIDIGNIGTPNFAVLNEGFDNIAEALNETVQNYFFLKDKGFGSSEVTGMNIIYTLTGRRVIGDLAQDFIFDKKYKLGKNRKSMFKLTWMDGQGNTQTLTCPCTFTKMQEYSGATTDVSAISVEISFNGAPTVAPGLDALTITSIAGSTTGTTKVTVNPAKVAGNSYKYVTASSVSLPVAGSVLTTGYTAWDGSADVTATTGNKILIVEVVTATNVVVKAGIATVTSKA